MTSSTVKRVPQHCAETVNDHIHCQTEEHIARYAAAGPAAIERRWTELDREGDIERTPEAHAATAVSVGANLGATVDRRCFFVRALVAGFLFQHAVQGWCPPLLLFRRLGFRTSSEIDHGRYALKTLRGDFRNVPAAHDGGPGDSVRKALQAVKR